MKINFKIYILIALTSLTARAGAAISYYSVENYRGRNDNPIYNAPSIGLVYLDDFEPPNDETGLGNKLITPHATGWNGSITGSPFRGVAEDSAPSDPDGGMGYRWNYAARVSGTEKDPSGIHFDFVPDENGKLPEYCGASLLGFYDLQNAGGLYNSIFVYDAGGNEVTGGAWQIPKPLLSDPLPDDPSDFFKYFAGIYVSGGISRINFRDFIEVDHLTYGYAIPEPSAAWLAAAAGLWLRRRRRSA